MARSISTSDAEQSATAPARFGPARRLAAQARVLVGLFAIYAPPALVVQLHKDVLAKVYLVVGIWAIEGILWYWLNDRAADHRRRQDAVRSVARH